MPKPRKSVHAQARTRIDGELYARPWPNPFSTNWNDGFNAGYDNEPPTNPVDKEWRDGFNTGKAQKEFDQVELDKAGSSNA